MWQVGMGWLRMPFCVVLGLAFGACAANRPPDPTQPQGSGAPAYPVFMSENKQRRDAALADWTSLTRAQGLSTSRAPELQPVTNTIKSVPESVNGVLYLPKVGQGTVMSEEETRESLRRFIASAQQLIGATPQQLSLEQRTDLADGNKRATYQQRPFRSPLRAGYGVLQITFAPDRRLIQISSTCIPNVENLQRSGVTPQVTSEEAVKRVLGRTFTVEGEVKQIFTVSTNQEVNVTSLVVYPRLRPGQKELEFHLAWEINVGKSPSHTVYMDAVSGEILGAI